MLPKLLLLFACIWAAIHGAILDHKITTLPGFEGALPSTHYSGYIPVGKLSGSSGSLHYWLIESTSNPSNDPVVLWLNGGPGSSSLIGLLTENGQIMTNDDSLTKKIDGVPQVFLNDYAWSKTSTTLYLESPKGVGFSFCDGARASSDCKNTDDSTALDAYEFLVSFFASFPEYKSNKFYITGESYAGIYIPMLIDQIDKDSLGAKINFAGAAIGNGCWGNTVGTCAFSSPEALHIKSDFYFGHGMYSQALHDQVNAACGDWKRLTPQCVAKLTEIDVQTGSFDVYNIYDECGADERRRLTEGRARKSMTEVLDEMSAPHVTVDTVDSFTVSAGYSQALNDYQCGGETAMNEYLAHPSVVKALNVKAGTPGMQYTKTATDLLPLYRDLFNRHPNKILIYSGDTDGCVPYVGTEQWTRGLNFTVLKDWHQWTAHPDMVHDVHKAGYAVTFDKFQFITINGAGHMVPTYQPGFALDMFNRFLNGETF